MNIVTVGVDCLAEVVINVQRIGVGSSGIDIGVSIFKRELTQQVNVLIVDVKSVVAVGSFDNIFQTIAIEVTRSINQGLRHAVASLNRIAGAVVVAVGVEEVDRRVTVGINWSQTVAHMPGRIAKAANARIIRVIQTIAVGIHKRRRATDTAWCDVVRGRLSFDVIGDAVVVAVKIQLIDDAVTIGVPRAENLRTRNAEIKSIKYRPGIAAIAIQNNPNRVFCIVQQLGRCR